ncbi:hypothetical protein GN956_G12492 [Arapaima gigas]
MGAANHFQHPTCAPLAPCSTQEPMSSEEERGLRQATANQDATRGSGCHVVPGIVCSGLGKSKSARGANWKQLELLTPCGEGVQTSVSVA